MENRNEKMNMVKIDKQKSLRKCMTSKFKPISQHPFKLTGEEGRSLTSCSSLFAARNSPASASVPLQAEEHRDATASQEGIIYSPAVIKSQINGSCDGWALLNQAVWVAGT